MSRREWEEDGTFQAGRADRSWVSSWSMLALGGAGGHATCAVRKLQPHVHRICFIVLQGGTSECEVLDGEQPSELGD